MEHCCKYRPARQGGLMCSSKCKGTYCSAHNTIANERQLILQNMFKIPLNNSTPQTVTNNQNLTITKDNIIELLFNIWKTYDSRQTEIIHDSLMYILDTTAVFNIAKEYIKNISKKNKKKDTINILINLFESLWKISQNPIAMYWIKKYQNKIKCKIKVSFNGPTDGNIQNESDPFSLESINEINKKELFAYTDSKNRIWAFNACDLNYHITENHTIQNPFTREDIPNDDLNRLSKLVKTLPNNKTTIEFLTIDQAYTHVLHFYEQEGFYIKNEWLNYLSPRNLQYICRNFSMQTYNRYQIFTYQIGVDIRSSSNNLKAHVIFAKEMLKLINSEHTQKFLIICYLLSCISKYSREMLNNLPNWINEAIEEE